MTGRDTMDSNRRLRTSAHALPAALLLVGMLAGTVIAESPVPGAQNALTAQVLDPDARIYAQRDPFSATLWLGRVGDVYDLRTKSGDWYEVALPDGRTGWIVGQHVVVMSARAARSPRPVAGTGRGYLEQQSGRWSVTP
jgi:hypothetical protein